MSKNPFTLKDRRQVYKNPWIDVSEDSVVRPDGTDGIFGVVRMVHGVSVLPILTDGSVILAREYKYAVGEETLEVFSGAIDAGESPEQAARRELLEESGYVASQWISLGLVDPFTTVIESRVNLFLAIGATRSQSPSNDTGEDVTTAHYSFDEAVKFVMESKITHAPSCVVILKALSYRR